MPNFMKIRPVGAEFHADGLTDIKKLTVAFRNVTNAPKKLLRVLYSSTQYWLIPSLPDYDV